MSTVLCIVDMQPYFKTHKKCLDEVIHQVKLAKRRKAPIVILEYKKCGPTHERILDELKGVKKVIIKQKEDDDGSREFLNAVKNIKYKKVRICGVNACYCVYETALGIKAEGIKLELPSNAIACECTHKCNMLKAL